MVFSPVVGLAAGDDAVERRPQRGGDRPGVDSGASPRAVAARRKAVPYSGPAAPPTLDIRVIAVSLRAAPGVSGWRLVKLGHARP